MSRPYITRRAGGGGGLGHLPLLWKLNVFAGLFLVAILVWNLYMGDLCEGVWSLPPQTNNPGYGPDELSLLLVLVLQSEKFFSTKINTSKFKFKKRNPRVTALSVTRLWTKSIYLLFFKLIFKILLLFFSNAGVSRSAAVVLGYLMSSNIVSLEDAMKILREARPCVKPNEGFVRQLQDYQKELGLWWM